MKKTVIVFLFLVAFTILFYSNTKKASSSTGSPFITICIDTSCVNHYPSISYDCTLYYEGDSTTGLSCGLINLNTCCSVDAAGLPNGNYYWSITRTGSTTCTGSLFAFSGSNVTYKFSCSSGNCSPWSKPHIHGNNGTI